MKTVKRLASSPYLFCIVAVTLLLAMTSSSIMAATFDVDMGKLTPPCGGAGASDIGFVDCTSGQGGIAVVGPTTIAVGDTVRWTMTSTPHTTTSETASTGGPAAPCGTGDMWDSGIANAFTPGFVFTHTFNTFGTCNYFCIIHPAIMQGQVLVGGEGPLYATVNVSKAGTGSGTVTGSGIDCGATCSRSIPVYPPYGPVGVTLTATPSPGSVFAGWGGGCSGTGACSAEIFVGPFGPNYLSVTATFNLIVTTTTTTSTTTTSTTTSTTTTTRPTTTTTTSSTTTIAATTTATTSSTTTTTIKEICKEKHKDKDKEKCKDKHKDKDKDKE